MNRKKIRTRGKLQFSKYFQEFEKGDNVAIVREDAIKTEFPKRLQGMTGLIQGRRGNSYFVEINDVNKNKRFLIKPIHLKKIIKIK